LVITNLISMSLLLRRTGWSAMGAYLAKAGVNCVVFERDCFPGRTLASRGAIIQRVFKDRIPSKMEEAKFPQIRSGLDADDKQKIPYQHGWEGVCGLPR